MGDMRIYQADQCVVFRRVAEQWGGLSNMAFSPMIYADIYFKTNEALYQACRFPDNPQLQRRIAAESSPMSAKRIAHEHIKYSRADWLEVRFGVMRWCLRQKYQQNIQTFGLLLYETGDMPIAESSARDQTWGAIPQPDGTLVGYNVLGRLLMELRAQANDIDYAEFIRDYKPSVRGMAINGLQITGGTL